MGRTVRDEQAIDRVPLKLRMEYEAKWSAYQDCCILGGTPEERASAYERARRVEERFNAAVIVAKSEILRENAKRAKPPSGRKTIPVK